MPNNKKPATIIAYSCDGPGCFKREDLVSKSDWVCRHTTNVEHAVNGPCEAPENYPERFVLGNGEELDYYERLPGEEL